MWYVLFTVHRVPIYVEKGGSMITQTLYWCTYKHRYTAKAMFSYGVNHRPLDLTHFYCANTGTEAGILDAERWDVNRINAGRGVSYDKVSLCFIISTLRWT